MKIESFPNKYSIDMLKMWPLVLCVMASLPYSLLEELAVKSKSLYPVMGVVDLYQKANMLDRIPLHCPIKDKRRVSSRYGYRKDPFTGKYKFHAGIDYACDLATTVHAAASGEVKFVGFRGGYGKCIEIKHKYGFSTIYGHLSEYYIKKGMYVRMGQIIGFVGTTGRSTGYHLHYEVRKNNRVIEPLFVSYGAKR